MRFRLPPLLNLGLAFAAVGLLAGCAGQPAATPPATTATAPATSAAATATATATPAPATSAVDNAGDTSGVEPVSCGDVGPSGGAQVDLIADSTPAGRVGCTEAINVISAYYRDAPTMSEGTGRHLEVEGWACSADTGAYGSGSIGCSRDGFAFHTEP
jgi:hypothetical protein